MTNQALVKRTDVNGNGLMPAPAQPPKQPAREVRPLSDEMVDALLAGRGFRGWLRAARVARVLGLFSLYLFLDTYDVRAEFNRRAVARLRDQAQELGRAASLRAWAWAQAYVLFDLFIRALRYTIFRGAEGSARKEARLHKQAVWL